ncbi:MAG: hypothetical protein CME32_03700 [Gimesia sp.]|nr:hypothetical protein [Gimesia sp.]
MTSHRIPFTALALIICAAILFSQNPPPVAQAAAMHAAPAWEYKIADASMKLGELETAGEITNARIKAALEQFLNQQGADGWELVSYSGTMAVYKRAVRN